MIKEKKKEEIEFDFYYYDKSSDKVKNVKAKITPLNLEIGIKIREKK